MSHSTQDRIRNMYETLLVLYRELGDNPIWTRVFAPSETAFANTFETTWTELEEKYLIEPCHTVASDRYRLTARGWLVAVQNVWGENKQVLNEQLAQLMRTLKAEADRPRAKGTIPFEELVRVSGLSAGFVFNAIDSKLIEERLNKNGARWDSRGRGSHIEIPGDFGQDLN